VGATVNVLDAGRSGRRELQNSKMPAAFAFLSVLCAGAIEDAVFDRLTVRGFQRGGAEGAQEGPSKIVSSSSCAGLKFLRIRNGRVLDDPHGPGGPIYKQ